MKLEADDLGFLKELAEATVSASRVQPGERVGNSPANTMGFAVIRPGGRECYPAYWIRDFAMSIASGFISQDEIVNHVRLSLRTQNGGSERKLKSGAIVPASAIADHVNFDGGAVFYPGTMSAGEDQGGEPFGVLPPGDDQYWVIAAAAAVKNRDFLGERIGGVPVIDRLNWGFAAAESDPSTGGMFTTSEPRRAVGFGFCDTVYLTGAILFPSLLRYVAATQLSQMRGSRGVRADEKEFRETAESVASHIPLIFRDPQAGHGWLLAATGVGRQPDVWGTLYALHLKILPDDIASRARRTIADAVRRGTITSQGAVRHIPTEFDASPTTAWERVAPGVAKGTYQNGAYWHTPTGWLVEALSVEHEDLAHHVFGDYISHLRGHDFRKEPAHGAPFECFTKDMGASQNPVYTTSVTVPYAVLRDLNEYGAR
ncbi:MAG TPA: hypothetical protein VF669_00080 [Tepidisphaeraceae bacterium]|jgi:hypothetical protein